MEKRGRLAAEKISKDFYLKADVAELAKQLLGKVLVTNIEKIGFTSGIIIETEAYSGITDRASHAFGNRRTGRTEVMYMEGGVAYIYLCYGVHSLFNVVTNKKNIPDAVLIRSIKPLDGMEIMMKRTNKKVLSAKDGIGPGKVSKLLALHCSLSSESLTGNKIWLEDRGVKVKKNQIVTGPRVGVDYAGSDALLPYRFRINLLGTQ